jgi:microcystin-dependent protein
MADPFVAEIRMFPFNFPPKGWAFCDGQLMVLSQNTALFALLGTIYGGNGKSTFALPNLQGSAPMHPGQGPGLSLHELGESGGTPNVTLLQTEMPAHSHSLGVWAGDPADHFDPTNMTLARSNNGQAWAAPTPLAPMSPQMVGPAGGTMPHNNMMPYLTVNFCIALQGVFPPRS